MTYSAVPSVPLEVVSAHVGSQHCSDCCLHLILGTQKGVLERQKGEQETSALLEAR